MTIQSDLNKIIQIKSDIHYAIKSKGVDIANDTPLEDYPGEIGKITGGGSMDTTELNVVNATNSTVKAGQKVWLTRIAMKATDYNIQSWSYPYMPGFLLNPSGDKLFNTDETNGYSDVTGITITNRVGSYSIGKAVVPIIYGPNNEFICRRNNESTYDIRCDISKWIAKQRINDFDLYGHYLGENIFYQVKAGYPKQENRLAVFDLQTGNVLKYWTVSSYWSTSQIFSSLVLKINNNTYVYNFLQKKRYLINFDAEEGTDISNFTSEDIVVEGDISNFYAITSTTDQKIIIGYRSDSNTVYLLEKINDKKFRLISADRYPSCLTELLGKNDYTKYLHYNPLTNIISIPWNQNNSSGGPSKLGDILVGVKYYGFNADGNPIFLPVYLNLPSELADNKEIIQYATFSANPPKGYICTTSNTWNFYTPKTVLFAMEYIADFQITEPSSTTFNNQSITAVVKNDIAPNTKGTVYVYKLDEVKANITTNANNADIQVF